MDKGMALFLTVLILVAVSALGLLGASKAKKSMDDGADKIGKATDSFFTEAGF